MAQETGKYWLNLIIEKILAAHPDGEIIVSSGVTPSGIYHIGSLREVLTADAITWGLKEASREARHLHFVDDFDVFRKVPAILEKSYEQHLGTPVYLVPAPDGSDKSYADFYFEEFKASLDRLRVDMEVIRSHQQYQAGKFTATIETALTNIPLAREIIEQTSGRQLPNNWTPVQILSDDNKLDQWSFKSINPESKTVTYTAEDGSEGDVNYAEGRVKLDWRLDWAARWAIWGVDVEPFGRDHATKGGSYDTSSVVVTKMFNGAPPFPVPYEFINLKGDTKKMSASKGTGITPENALAVMPPEVLRYFVLEKRPSLQLIFDTGLGFPKLMDDFAKLERNSVENGQPSQLYQLAMLGRSERVLSDVSFGHIVTAYQSANGDEDEAVQTLVRSESGSIEEQTKAIKSTFTYAKKWLETWAPEEVKFSLQDELPTVELSQAQKDMLAALANQIEANGSGQDGEWFHKQVYEQREKLELEPAAAFQAIYRVLLNQDSGPKAGWFLSILEQDWLVKRFRLKA